MPRPLSHDGAGAVGVERHRHRVAIAGERLVDGVVDHLVDHVMQARAVIGVADIHARALAHGVEPAQHLDRVRVVFFGRRVVGIRVRSFCIVPHIGMDRRVGDGEELCLRPRGRRKARLGAGEPGLRREPASAAKSAARRVASRCAATSSSSSNGRRSRDLGPQPRMGQHDGDQQRLLLAGRA